MESGAPGKQRLRALRIGGLAAVLVAVGWSWPESELERERVHFDIRLELTVEPEHPRNPLERRRDFFPEELKGILRSQLRMDRTPYACADLAGLGAFMDTEIEHIVALAEARDSGLPAEDVLDFAHDPENLTLATKTENRRKGDRDAADYLPEHNQCWFAGKVLSAKQRWGLSVDEREAVFLKTAMAGCSPGEIARPRCDPLGPEPVGPPEPSMDPSEWLDQCDANENGRVTCSEAFTCGAPLPVTRDHPLYAFMSDGDLDGLVCE